ncbi:unnamed protein product, partial [Rotaria sordida]
MSNNNKNVGEIIGTAVVSYIVTNIDDLVILMNFFTEATISSSSLKVHHIFIGQYVGFSILLGVSLIGFGVSYALPVKMLGFLGFLPIILGIKGIIEIIIEEYKKSTININDIIPNDNISTIELETIRYRNDINEQIISEFTIQQQEITNSINSSRTLKFKEKLLNCLSPSFNPHA